MPTHATPSSIHKLQAAMALSLCVGSREALMVLEERAQMTPITPSDGDLEAHLQDLLGGLSDEELSEITALAEAMHSEGADQ